MTATQESLGLVLLFPSSLLTFMQFKTSKLLKPKHNLRESLDSDEASHPSDANSDRLYLVAADAELAAALLKEVLTELSGKKCHHLNLISRQIQGVLLVKPSLPTAQL